MAPRRWESALHTLAPFLLKHEIKSISSNIAADNSAEAEANEVVASAGQNPGKLIDFFKSYILPEPQPGDAAGYQSFSNFIRDFDERVHKKMQMLGNHQEMPDFSRILEWLPREDDPYSLGLIGSSRVDRTSARLEDISVDGFPAFWQSNGGAIVASIPVDSLKQRVTDESMSEVRQESYMQQRYFLVELARAIARFRGVFVEITWGEDAIHERGGYHRIPDSYLKIGRLTGDIEQKTPGDRAEVAKASGQVVILGNILWRERTRYERFDTFENEVYGFVGTALDLQCLRQIHAYPKRVRCYDGPLLALAQGSYRPGDQFQINVNSEAVKWAAATLDRMVMTEAATLRAGSEVCKDVFRHDYGTCQLTVTSGYWIGREFLSIPTEKAPVESCTVTVLGATRNNDIAAVLRVLWGAEIWWLKVGPDAESRQAALEEPEELPTGGWERWFQTERDMLFRTQLTGDSSVAFPVSIAGTNRPAMLVKDAGESIEKLLFSRDMAPCEVYDMSKQVFDFLEACGKQALVHGDVCLENICVKDGRYSLIDWGLACGRPFAGLVAAVNKAWPDLGVMEQVPGIPNWETSANCCFYGMRPLYIEGDMESLLYCCMKVLGGGTLPWSHAAASGTEEEVLELRSNTVVSFVEVQGHCIYKPLLLRLGLVSSSGGRRLKSSLDHFSPKATLAMENSSGFVC